MRFHAFVISVVVLCCGAGCSAFPHNQRPLSADAKILGYAAQDTVVELLAPYSFSLWGATYTLPPGTYVPESQDDHGIFYKAPSPIITVHGDETRQYAGGLHLPKVKGSYYSFASIYVFFGDSPKLHGLPDEFLNAQNKTWGVAYRPGPKPDNSPKQP